MASNERNSCGFKFINEEHSIVKFYFEDDFTIDEFRKFLGVLSLLIDRAEKVNKPFGFYVDAQNAKIPPLNGTKTLISWMIKEKPRLKRNQLLKVSAVCIKSKGIADMLNTVMKLQPPVSTNLITNDLSKAVEFTRKHMISLGL